MRVIVTGSAGFIGQRICVRLRTAGREVVECDREEDVLSFVPPEADAVIHLAAIKYATEGEDSPYETSRFNLEATAAALQMAPKVVLASTCKAASPITCYGASKLICERMVLNAGGTVVRLVNVLGSVGSVTDIWAEVPQDEPLPVTDCFRLFMEPPAAANLLVRALELPAGRYAPASVKGMDMDDVAATLYPGRPTTRVALRVGDRPKERLRNDYEQLEPYDQAFHRVLDVWEARPLLDAKEKT
jgi:FlaA1/EpsC-like NDP-sugar epimerase